LDHHQHHYHDIANNVENIVVVEKRYKKNRRKQVPRTCIKINRFPVAAKPLSPSSGITYRSGTVTIAPGARNVGLSNAKPITNP